jgi:hypothetical protein
MTTPTHLQLLAIEADRCVECGARDAELGCERCGAGLHDPCYFERVTPVAEAQAYYDMDAGGSYAFVCRGCRS